jgi:hypothetical protein
VRSWVSAAQHSIGTRWFARRFSISHLLRSTTWSTKASASLTAHSLVAHGSAPVKASSGPLNASLGRSFCNHLCISIHSITSRTCCGCLDLLSVSPRANSLVFVERKPDRHQPQHQHSPLPDVRPRCSHVDPLGTANIPRISSDLRKRNR